MFLFVNLKKFQINFHKILFTALLFPYLYQYVILLNNLIFNNYFVKVDGVKFKILKLAKFSFIDCYLKSKNIHQLLKNLNNKIT